MSVVVEVNSFLGITDNELLAFVLESNGGEVLLHDARNRISRCRLNGRILVKKEFGRTLWSRIIYAIRKSKAQRSFANALELLDRGVATPDPVGYIDWRGVMNTLDRSCYICDYEESVSLYECVVSYGRECLSAFAKFVAYLHEKGILHDDLNNTNVRVTRDTNGDFKFSLIDLNRMRFYKHGVMIPLNECFRNICRFSSLDDDYLYFVGQYLFYREMPRRLMSKAIDIKKRHDRRYDFKKRLKKL